MNKVAPLTQKTPQQTDITTVTDIATVKTVKNGRATTLDWPSQSPGPVAVYGQLSHVTAVTVNDSVLVQHTQSGPIIIGVISKPADKPAATIQSDNDHITIPHAKSFKLECEHAIIEISPSGSINLSGAKNFQLDCNGARINIDSHGRIQVDGKTLQLQGNDLLALKGRPIKVN